jgi:type II secretory pathway predicted ATPase ExeA
VTGEVKSSEAVLDQFGLQRAPFEGKSLDGTFYAGTQHREALAFLERALHSNDLLLALTGEPGTGKSTTVQHALRQTLPDALMATICLPAAEPDAFLAALLKGFGFEGVAARHDEMRGLLAVFLAHQRQKGITTVIIAENPEVISSSIIEEIGWLSLLQPVRQGRLKLVLLGGEALERQLAAPRMHALKQMIRWHHRLEVLSADETRDYLEFHIESAGCARAAELFAPNAVARIHALSGGIPARIDQLATHALAAATEANETIVAGARVELPGGGGGIADRPRPRRIDSLDILLDHNPMARIGLNASRLLIGRHPWNDVPLDDDSVSRHHAMLVRESGHWTIVDLNSTNGIRINDRVARQQRLRHGDVVQIGRFRLVLSEGGGRARSLPAAGDVADTTILPG